MILLSYALHNLQKQPLVEHPLKPLVAARFPVTAVEVWTDFVLPFVFKSEE